jgi:hypothetical protein
MAELVNEVKFDFSGAAMLAGHLQRAQRYSGLISKDMQDAMKAARDSRQSLIQSRIPGGIAGSGHPAGVAGGMSAAGQFAAMAGAAAGGSAFFYRSTALANPAATQRFHDALDDMAAVIGHQLVPALREMTPSPAVWRLARQSSDREQGNRLRHDWTHRPCFGRHRLFGRPECLRWHSGWDGFGWSSVWLWRFGGRHGGGNVTGRASSGGGARDAVGSGVDRSG